MNNKQFKKFGYNNNSILRPNQNTGKVDHKKLCAELKEKEASKMENV